MRKLLAILGLVGGYKSYKRGRSRRHTGTRRRGRSGIVSMLLRRLSGSRY